MQSESKPICNKAYGCINVRVGKEMNVVRMIRTAFPEVEVHAILQMKHRRCNGVRSYSHNIMIPGYILFRTYEDMPVSQLLKVTFVNSILRYTDFSWRLRGDDLNFSKWIFRNNGTIGVSIAYTEDDEIKIADGPLKQIGGKILCINKRSRSAQVSFMFEQHVFKLWLPFEWMEKSPDRKSGNYPYVNRTVRINGKQNIYFQDYARFKHSD